MGVVKIIFGVLCFGVGVVFAIGAAELLEESAPRPIREELARNIAELDQLIEELLLASRLDAGDDAGRALESFDLTALLAEECARAGASLSAPPLSAFQS